jgi:hypothetical protein
LKTGAALAIAKPIHASRDDLLAKTIANPLPRRASWPVGRATCARFFRGFFKKEQEKQSLLFEKRSKNFCLFGARGAAGSGGTGRRPAAFPAGQKLPRSAHAGRKAAQIQGAGCWHKRCRPGRQDTNSDCPAIHDRQPRSRKCPCSAH